MAIGALSDREDPARPEVSHGVAALFEAAGRKPPMWDDLAPIVGANELHLRISAEAARLIQDEDGLAAFGDHEAVLSHGSAAERLAFYAVSRRLSVKAFKARRRLLDELSEEPSPLSDLSIDRIKGLLVTPQGEWTPVAEAVEEARARALAGRGRAIPLRDGRGVTIPLGADVMGTAIMRLGRRPDLLRLVGRYLDGLPILYRINLLEFPAEPEEQGAMAAFRLDPEDFRQVKVFLLVEDVDEDCGPLHLLAAHSSDRARMACDHRLEPLGEDQVLDIAEPAVPVVCTGLSGTLAIADTSRCLYFQGRPGRRPRVMVAYQYITPFACVFAIDAQVVNSKYAKGLRKAIDRGEAVSERDQRLFGVVR
jgi:hypothetical protein